MNEAMTWVLALLAGMALGVIFYGGLWWTIRRGVPSPRAVFWFFGSLTLRMGIAVAGLYFVGRGHLLRLLMCLLGFMIARLVITWLTLKPREAGHAH